MERIWKGLQQIPQRCAAFLDRNINSLPLRKKRVGLLLGAGGAASYCLYLICIAPTATVPFTDQRIIVPQLEEAAIPLCAKEPLESLNRLLDSLQGEGRFSAIVPQRRPDSSWKRHFIDQPQNKKHER